MWLQFYPVSPECNDLRHCIQKVNSRDQASLSKRGDSRFPRSVRSAKLFVPASRRWTFGIRRLSRSVLTAVSPVQSGVQRPSSLHPKGELLGSGVSLEAMWLQFYPVSPECNDLRHCIQKVNSRDQASLSKRGDSRFPRSVRSAKLFVPASRRWTFGIRRLSRSVLTAVSPVQSGVQRPSSLHPKGELLGSGVSLEAMWLQFYPVSPECNDLRHCIQKVNSRDQASLSKRGDSRFPRSVRSAKLFVPASRRWTFGIRRLSRSVLTAVSPVQSGVQRPSSLHPKGELLGSDVSFEAWWPEFNDLRHCIQKVNSRDQASLSKRGDSRFPLSVRNATTFVNACRRWTLGIRRLSRNMLTAIFPVYSIVQRPSSLHPEGELSGSGVSLEICWQPFSRSVRSATTYVTASKRWTLGIRRLSRSVVTAVFPGQSGVQRPTSLHPEGEFSGSGVSLEAWWQPFSPFSPECNDLLHCIQKVNAQDQASTEGELSGSGVSLEACWQPFPPFNPECNDLRHCIQNVNSRDQASLEEWWQPFFQFNPECNDLRHCIQKVNYWDQTSLLKRGDRRFPRSVPSSLHPEDEFSGSGVSLEIWWQPFFPFSP